MYTLPDGTIITKKYQHVETKLKEQCEICKGTWKQNIYKQTTLIYHYKRHHGDDFIDENMYMKLYIGNFFYCENQSLFTLIVQII